MAVVMTTALPRYRRLRFDPAAARTGADWDVTNHLHRCRAPLVTALLRWVSGPSVSSQPHAVLPHDLLWAQHIPACLLTYFHSGPSLKRTNCSLHPLLQCGAGLDTSHLTPRWRRARAGGTPGWARLDKELLSACPHLRHQAGEEAAELWQNSLLRPTVDKTTRRGDAPPPPRASGAARM